MRSNACALLFLAALTSSGITICGEEKPAPNRKPPKAASMLAVRNTVQAISEKTGERALKPKDSVFLNDTVQTKKRSRAQMMFVDKSIVGLGPNAELVVKEYVFDSKKKTGKLKMDVKNGAFRVLGGALSKSDGGEVEVETPVATCGIRGSMMIGSYDAATRTLVVAPLAGTLTVRTSAGKRFTVTAKAEEGRVRGVAVTQPKVKSKKKKEAKKKAAEGEEEGDGEDSGEDEAPSGTDVAATAADGQADGGAVAAMSKPLSGAELSSANAAAGVAGTAHTQSAAAEAPESTQLEVDLTQVFSSPDPTIVASDAGDEDDVEAVIFFHPDISVALDTIRSYNIIVSDIGAKHALDVAEQAATGPYSTREESGNMWDIEKSEDLNLKDIAGLPSYMESKQGYSLSDLRNMSYSEFNTHNSKIIDHDDLSPGDTNYFAESDYNRIKDHTGNFTNLNLEGISANDFR
jgi:hypothetical protein